MQCYFTRKQLCISQRLVMLNIFHIPLGHFCTFCENECFPFSYWSIFLMLWCACYIYVLYVWAHIFVYVHIFSCVHMYVEARSGFQMFYLIVLYFIFWDWVSHWTCSSPISSCQQTPGDLPFPASFVLELQIHSQA